MLDSLEYHAPPLIHRLVGRPAHEGMEPGYARLCMQYLAAVSKRYPSFWVGAFVRYDSLVGASFADSPLVRSKDYFAGGVAISWILGESSTRVVLDERTGCGQPSAVVGL